MLYVNITEKPVMVSKGMIRTRIASGAEINLTMTDIRHTRGSMRFLEAKNKKLSVIEEKSFEIALPSAQEDVDSNLTGDMGE